jgi:hypothetical protein
MPLSAIFQLYGNSSYGITGIWELVTEGLFPVVVCGKLETNIRTGLASTVALWEEDLDKMNGSCFTFILQKGKHVLIYM